MIPSGGNPSLQQGPKRILIVEDEQDIANLLSEALTDGGYLTESVATAADAEGLLQRQKFDCILLDLRLSIDSGEQVVHFIRDTEGLNQATPVLIMSGLMDPGLRIRLQDRINDILIKPFNLPTLINKIQALTSTSPVS